MPVGRPPCSSCSQRRWVNGQMGAEEKLGSGLGLGLRTRGMGRGAGSSPPLPQVAPNARGSRPAATSNTARLPLLLHAWLRLSASLRLCISATVT
ncbi:hypothetical protein NDU88_004784 [Pleurodeles waltl]|uniref:Uncharacterized protein n=1 Tax=Pleurodeles waltl TaxID=8319 RepID=A0AAV7TTJ4_PLEWA|nr:hypothetical protein NDU88_004784 [Pleurodeles waltl]